MKMTTEIFQIALVTAVLVTTIDLSGAMISCAGNKCSHLCLVRITEANGGKWQNAYCACPEGSGLILDRDGKTCTKELSLASCGESEWSCEKGKKQCIPIQWRCDGNSECSDHSDEIGCPKCGVGNFRCTNENCINATLICDGRNDCKDSSDEVKCCPGPN